MFLMYLYNGHVLASDSISVFSWICVETLVLPLSSQISAHRERYAPRVSVSHCLSECCTAWPCPEGGDFCCPSARAFCCPFSHHIFVTFSLQWSLTHKLHLHSHRIQRYIVSKVFFIAMLCFVPCFASALLNCHLKDIYRGKNLWFVDAL